MDEEAVREASWYGTENARKSQGTCLPPSRPKNTTPRYKIVAGTNLSISKVSPLFWKGHTTTKELAFERHEGYRDGYYTFRESGYLILVRSSRVIHRDDESN